MRTWTNPYYTTSFSQFWDYIETPQIYYYISNIIPTITRNGVFPHYTFNVYNSNVSLTDYEYPWQ